MSGQQFESGDETRCVDCGGQFFGGEALHCMKLVSYLGDGKQTVRFEYRCRECIERFSRAFWPEDYGPYPDMPIPAPSGRPS